MLDVEGQQRLLDLRVLREHADGVLQLGAQVVDIAEAVQNAETEAVEFIFLGRGFDGLLKLAQRLFPLLLAHQVIDQDLAGRNEAAVLFQQLTRLDHTGLHSRIVLGVHRREVLLRVVQGHRFEVGRLDFEGLLRMLLELGHVVVFQCHLRERDLRLEVLRLLFGDGQVLAVGRPVVAAVAQDTGKGKARGHVLVVELERVPQFDGGAFDVALVDKFKTALEVLFGPLFRAVAGREGKERQQQNEHEDKGNPFTGHESTLNLERHSYPRINLYVSGSG